MALSRIRHQRTRAVLAMLRHLGGARRRGGRVPQMQHPDLIGLEYYKAIVPISSGLARLELGKVEGEILRLLEEARMLGTLDASSPFPGSGGPRRFMQSLRAAALVDKAAAATVEAYRPKEEEIKGIAAKFGRRTDDFNRQQIDKQTKVALGVPLSAIERPSKLDIEGFAAQNVELISSVSDRYFDRLRLDIVEAFEKGIPAEQLAEQFKQRYGMSLDDSLRIARDQVGKLNAQVNAERQKSIGVQRFTWRTMRDNAVCDYCASLDGQSFRYDDPPECMPGECHPNDRCYGQADYSSLLDDD